jgi:hypothetical protein
MNLDVELLLTHPYYFFFFTCSSGWVYWAYRRTVYAIASLQSGVELAQGSEGK